MYDIKNLEEYDFVTFYTKYGHIDCVFLGFNKNRVKMLMTEPYENSPDPEYSFVTFEFEKDGVYGYMKKKFEDLFMLLGKEDPRILKMQEKYSGEGIICWKN